MRRLNIIALLLPITIGGCVSTAVDLATMPIKGAGKVIGRAAESTS